MGPRHRRILTLYGHLCGCDDEFLIVKLRLDVSLVTMDPAHLICADLPS